MAKEALGDVMDKVADVKGTHLLATRVSGVDMQGLMNLGDQLKAKLGEGVIVLASEKDGKVSLLAMATDGAMKWAPMPAILLKELQSLWAAVAEDARIWPRLAERIRLALTMR